MLVLLGLAEDADPEAYIGFVFVIYWGFHTSGYRLGSAMWADVRVGWWGVFSNSHEIYYRVGSFTVSIHDVFAYLIHAGFTCLFLTFSYPAAVRFCSTFRIVDVHIICFLDKTILI